MDGVRSVLLVCVWEKDGSQQVLRRLQSFSRVRGLVFGAYGEASADVHALLDHAATAQPGIDRGSGERQELGRQLRCVRSSSAGRGDSLGWQQSRRWRAIVLHGSRLWAGLARWFSGTCRRGRIAADGA